MGFNYFLSSFPPLSLFYVVSSWFFIFLLLLASLMEWIHRWEVWFLRVTTKFFVKSNLCCVSERLYDNSILRRCLSLCCFAALHFFLRIHLNVTRLYPSILHRFHNILCHICALMETNYFHFDGCFNFSLSSSVARVLEFQKLSVWVFFEQTNTHTQKIR